MRKKLKNDDKPFDSPSSITPKKQKRWGQTKETRRHLLQLRKKLKMMMNQGGSPSSILCPFTNWIKWISNTHKKTPTNIIGVVPFDQEFIQMLYTSLPFSSLPLHLLGGGDIPTYKKVQ
jgi:hypothetical protein